MSTAPNGYQTPKTNWAAGDIPTASDFNRSEGNINAIEVGSRTLDQAQNPSGNSGSLRQILDWLVNRIKAISGKTNWYDSPDITLAGAKSHVDSASAHSATSSATANRMVLRDGSGRAQFAAPSSFGDAATKGYVDSLMTAANLRVYDRATSTVEVVNSDIETTIYSKTITGGDLGTNGGLRLILVGDYLNNVGPSANQTLRFKFGDTILFSQALGVSAASSTRYSWRAELVLFNESANSQKAIASIIRDNTMGDASATGSASRLKVAAAAENTASAKTLAISVQHNLANASHSTRLLFASLEHFRP